MLLSVCRHESTSFMYYISSSWYIQELNRHRHRCLQGDKDKKIEELKTELEHQEQLCIAYREKLFNFISKVEEQTEELSSKIQVIISNLRQVESGIQKHYPCRRPQ